eukprot:CAMPEP_0178435146 /NCGR_PEP_ID=MMETSP0689_2-20121128/33779_1 /TAXON_ID=160604 /ORGANISM="Amphidinium massartii, Strain CS-259" /LENGTH=202 /DNA_ID=CAMNT_0020057213 /DNA_START=11 /DNA_END=619 /DNA_ORIENTATION=-
MSQSFRIPSDPLRRVSWDGYEVSKKEEVSKAAEDWLNIIMGVSIFKDIISFFFSWVQWFVLVAFWYVGVVVGDIGMNRMTRTPLALFQFYCVVSVLLGVSLGAYLLNMHYTVWHQLHDPELAKQNEGYPPGTKAGFWFHLKLDDWFQCIHFLFGLVCSVGYCLFIEPLLHIYAIYWTYKLMREWDEEEAAMEYKDADLYDHV